MKKTRLLSTLILGLCTGGFGLHGQSIVVNYDFGSSLAATSSEINVTAAAVGGLNTGDTAVAHSGGAGTTVADYTPIDNGGGNGPSGRAFGRFWDTDVSGDFQHYFDWSFSVDSGTIQLGNGSNVEVDLGARNQGPTTYAIAYSMDGFSSQTFIAGTSMVAADGLSTLVNGTPPDNTNFDWKRVNHTFNAGTISAGTTVDFRLYLGESGANSSSEGNFYIDNLTVTAVPEASTSAIVAGMFGLGFVMWRRMRRS